MKPSKGMKEVYVAVDFGATSGRVIAGCFNRGQLELEIISRFPNRQVRLGNHTYWDFLALFQDMKDALRETARKGYRIKSIGIDTWGVDFGLLDRQGNLLGNPICYRDPFTTGLPEELFSGPSAAEHYAEAGIQIMPINSIYQLYGLKKEGDARLETAGKLLFMPDLFSYYLTGTANNEYTIASTSELINARTRGWNRNLIDRLGLPQRLFGDIVMPGTSRGQLLPEVAAEIGVSYPVEVIAVASHDTASAAYALPEHAKQTQSAFLSSGTWSLLGTILDEPVLTEDARLAGFSNEGGAQGKICFLQNITGLWLLERLRVQWSGEGKETDYETLIKEAEASTIGSIVDVDDPDFQKPGEIAQTIARHCTASGQAMPVTQGDYVLCIMRSLAERYKKGIQQLGKLSGKPVKQLCIIGGGSKNRLLNALTQQVTGLPVVTGPAEATAIGNILIQAGKAQS